jgi:SAM-dependent methyltransferase
MNPRTPGSFPTRLYDSYVSSFKHENASLTASELAHYYKGCDARYYPALESLPKSAAILELGCGHGRMLHYLQHKGFTNVKGIDISAEQIAIAQREGLNAERADVFDFLNRDGSSPLRGERASSSMPGEGIDCVIAIDFVEHFTKEELLRMFELIHAKMKSGGILLIQTVNGEGLFPQQIIYGDLTHQTILSPGSMGQLLAAVGFSDVKFSETAPLASGAKGIFRSAIWNIIRASANFVRKIESGKTQSVWTENFICSARR